MEKGRKMRRYSRKDYTQLVDFPVEIVGRDGVVRRYSFEESVRLYQRRIASAALRYQDDEVVNAEVEHCRSRIEQLRKSYFARYGWSGIHVMGATGALEDGLAAEVAAFIRRWLEPDEVDPEALEFSFLEESSFHQLYFVRRPPGLKQHADAASAKGSDHLLYLYRFEQAGTCVARDEFFRFLKVLQGVRRIPEGVESLMAFHHTADCGLVLTGQGGGYSAQDAGSSEEEEPQVDPHWLEDADHDPLRDGMSLLRRGERQQALRRFVQAYERNHFRRAAYVGAAVVADQLGEHVEAETAALMGSRYFPEDAVLHYHLAVARLRRGALVEAGEALTLVESLEGGHRTYATGLLGALLLLLQGSEWAARRRLASLPEEAEPEDADLQRAFEWIRRQLRIRDVLRGCSAGVVVVGVVSGLLLSPWLGLLSVLGLASMPLVDRAWKHSLEGMVTAPGEAGLRLANPGALKRLGDVTERQQ